MSMVKCTKTQAVSGMKKKDLQERAFSREVGGGRRDSKTTSAPAWRAFDMHQYARARCALEYTIVAYRSAGAYILTSSSVRSPPPPKSPTLRSASTAGGSAGRRRADSWLKMFKKVLYTMDDVRIRMTINRSRLSHAH